MIYLSVNCVFSHGLFTKAFFICSDTVFQRKMSVPSQTMVDVSRGASTLSAASSVPVTQVMNWPLTKKVVKVRECV